MNNRGVLVAEVAGTETRPDGRGAEARLRVRRASCFDFVLVSFAPSSQIRLLFMGILHIFASWQGEMFRAPQPAFGIGAPSYAAQAESTAQQGLLAQYLLETR